MLDEKKLQRHINIRLSGLNASDARRDRIRQAVREQEPEGTHVKRKMSLSLAFALIATLLAATFAIAEGLNLFGFFGRHSERYAQLAPAAILPTTSPVTVENASVGPATAVIDSAYFDGMTLNLTLRIDDPAGVEMYTPTVEELAQMDSTEPQPMVVVPNDPNAWIAETLNAAIATRTPCGYREWAIAAADHILTDDGIDLPPAMGMIDYTEDGALVELREFEYPLPEPIQDRASLNVEVTLKRYISTLYFDGTRLYFDNAVEPAGLVTASIPRAEVEPRTMTGEGYISGVFCRATAQVSPMSAVVTLHFDAPLNTFLATPPEGIHAHDAWVDMTATDEAGQSLRPTNGAFLDDRTEVLVNFDGTGKLPQTLTIHLYTTWEGENAPDAPQGPGIILR